MKGMKEKGDFFFWAYEMGWVRGGMKAILNERE